VTSVCCRWVGVGRVSARWWQHGELLALSLRCVGHLDHLAIGEDHVTFGKVREEGGAVFYTGEVKGQC